MMTVRSLLFNVGFIVITIVWALLCVFVVPLPYRWRYGFISGWAIVNLWWLRITCGITHDVKGVENIPDRACVVLSKHQSTWETLFFVAYLPPMAYILKRELLFVPFFGWGLALTEPIAIDRRSGRKAVQSIIETGTRLLRLGRWIVVFPEGTRIAAGHKGRYGVGGAVLAERSGFPVLPVAHNGGELWPRRSFVKKTGVITVVFGELMETEGLSAEQVNRQSERWIESTMVQISRVPYPAAEQKN